MKIWEVIIILKVPRIVILGGWGVEPALKYVGNNDLEGAMIISWFYKDNREVVDICELATNQIKRDASSLLKIIC